MKFIEFKHPSGTDTPHIARALATEREAQFLLEHALTFAAVDNGAVVGPEYVRYDRVLTTVRAVWEIIALELEGGVLAAKLTGDDGLTATRLCHEIRSAVLRNRFHYHGLG